MDSENNRFLKTLSKQPTRSMPLYCTGFPESDFIKNYIKEYDIKPKNDKALILKKKDYSIISQMGFDAISIWDFRRGKGGYDLNKLKALKVDGWGRIYKEKWYQWDGVFKDEQIIDKWPYLNLPLQKDINKLEKFLQNIKGIIDLVLSLPGLFEKTWQSMGFLYFSKCLRKNVTFIEKVINFFTDYIKKLIKMLQNVGGSIFLVADDCGYKNRMFIPKQLWEKYFFHKYKEIIEIIHDHDHKVIIHSDGYISEMIDIFIKLEFDAVQSLEPNSGVDIFSLFKKFSNQIVFIGNFDSILLTYGTPIQVKQYVEKLIIKAKESNCFLIISPTQQIHSKVKPENINTIFKTIKKKNRFKHHESTSLI